MLLAAVAQSQIFASPQTQACARCGKQICSCQSEIKAPEPVTAAAETTAASQVQSQQAKQSQGANSGQTGDQGASLRQQAALNMQAFRTASDNSGSSAANTGSSNQTRASAAYQPSSRPASGRTLNLRA